MRLIKDTVERKRIQDLRALFKKAVRIVSVNNHWVDTDHDDDPKFSYNVQKNISNLVRTSRRKAGLLTSAEKTLIRIPQRFRTIPERKRLCSLFSKLRCFVDIPPKHRARLVPLVRLFPIQPGRNLIRQGDLPLTVYFILVGEIQMISGSGNDVVAVYGPGERVGAAELLENRARTHNFRTVSYCELLVLFEYDFDAILRTRMTKTWEEKKRAIKALDYFEFFDNDQIIEACRFGSLKQYNPLETIYFEDKGSVSKVHFVLSGECVILQCLTIESVVKKGKKVQQLSNIDGDSNIFRADHRSTFTTQSGRIVEIGSNFSIADLVQSSSSSDETKKKHSLKRKMELRDIQIACGFKKVSETAVPFKRLTLIRRSKSKVSASSIKTIEYLDGEEDWFEDLFEDYWEDFWEEDLILPSPVQSHLDFDMGLEIRKPFYPGLISVVEKKSDESEVYTVASTPSYSSDSMSLIAASETRFIDVGSLTFGAIFGLGESMIHRVIMAKTIVQCLTLPRFFLLDPKQNPGNIWERRLLYLNSMIPTREKLFQHLLRTQEWKKFKNNFVNETVTQSAVNCADINDVPIICRIMEREQDIN
ncbi:uncharacterized protein Dana_GF17086, isoform B [Drosophila ananassae]|uniref:Uncharacterized protein, isoform B n=3 Tax=Drosophila ananassae TaxID=7217 RepID=A0A0P9C7Z9_DROAN|nr:uncharacterized protein LOC6499874 isoform X1 [Drosophila ananassae]KPU79641.1 uncharacterized protein Dana_GF17086, isoform B [Drosophila ananassae]